MSGCEQLRIFARVVLEVGVLDDDEVAGRLLNAATQGGAFAHIAGLPERPKGRRILALEGLEDFPRCIGGAVIDAQQFDRNTRICREYTLDCAPQGSALVVDRHDNRQFHGLEDRSLSPL